ncbi:hypothetical protein [Hymenobacter sp. AT01-02]|uniref:hypothetical protein n=1 Tax=Hymenobacter sp. AT01-02 TaxID=1571877 RepID=UPI0005F14C91|nr:hypothetical protein [Hymenobacter sp. AT01-02]
MFARVSNEVRAIQAQAYQLQDYTGGSEVESITLSVCLHVWLIYLGHAINPSLPSGQQQALRRSYEQLCSVSEYMEALPWHQLRDQLLEAVAPLWEVQETH